MNFIDTCGSPVRSYFFLPPCVGGFFATGLRRNCDVFQASALAEANEKPLERVTDELAYFDNSMLFVE